MDRMKLFVDKEKKKYIDATLVCSKCKRDYPVDEMEEHVRNCKGEQPGYS